LGSGARSLCALQEDVATGRGENNIPHTKGAWLKSATKHALDTGRQENSGAIEKENLALLEKIGSRQNKAKSVVWSAQKEWNDKGLGGVRNGGSGKQPVGGYKGGKWY